MSEVRRPLSVLKQARSLETRRRLVVEAHRLWRERGYDETTVDEVCEAAGIAKGTFYFYFRTKEDLLVEMSRSAAVRSFEEWRARECGDETTAELLDEVVRTMARRFSRTPRPLLEKIVMELLARIDVGHSRQGRVGYHDVFVDVLRRGQDRGEVSREAPAEEYALMLETVLTQSLLLWARGAEEPLEQMMLRRARTIQRGASAR